MEGRVVNVAAVQGYVPQFLRHACVVDVDEVGERPMHPYELAATMRERHQDMFIRLNFGTLYHTVDALEKDGWIVPLEREKEGRRPERTIYELTDSGRAALVQVLSDLLARPKREYPHFVAGLMFMHHLEAAQAAHQLKERIAALDAHLDKVRHILGELRARGLTRLSIIEVEHKIAMLEAERNWVNKLEQEITDGKLEWVVGIDTGQVKLRRGHVSSAN